MQEGKADNKAQVVRRALKQYLEDELLEDIRKAHQEIKDGKAISGDLKTIIENMS